MVNPQIVLALSHLRDRHRTTRHTRNVLTLSSTNSAARRSLPQVTFRDRADLELRWPATCAVTHTAAHACPPTCRLHNSLFLAAIRFSRTREIAQKVPITRSTTVRKSTRCATGCISDTNGQRVRRVPHSHGLWSPHRSIPPTLVHRVRRRTALPPHHGPSTPALEAGHTGSTDRYAPMNDIVRGASG